MVIKILMLGLLLLSRHYIALLLLLLLLYWVSMWDYIIMYTTIVVVQFKYVR